MRITLVTGGARSGKSGYAESLASRLTANADQGPSAAQGAGVTYIATARIHDAEMARRVERHRSDRPSGWETLEAPLAVDLALARARFPVVILDCLTLLLSNHILALPGTGRFPPGGVDDRPEEFPVGRPGSESVGEGGSTGEAHPAPEDDLVEAEVEARSQRMVTELLSAASDREGDLIVVTNEVGMGIVPLHPLGRWFRDAQGWANQALARRAVRVVLLVSGVPWVLQGEP